MAENFTLGTATLDTEVSLDGLKAGLSEAEATSQTGFDKIGSLIGGALTAGIAIAGAAIAVGIAAIVQGVGDAREANQLMAQTEAVITSTGGAAERSSEQITDLATALSAASGKSLFGDSDIQSAENLLLTFTNIKGAVFDAATAISVDMAQALGGAPKDQAIALGKALNDPIAGVTALSRVGVTFTEQQKEQIKTMQEAGDVAGAQTIILNELNKEFGGSAEAAAKADGGWAQFQDRLGEAQETLGAAFIPLLNQGATLLNDTVAPALESAAAALSAFLADPATQQAIKDFTDTLVNQAGAAFTWLSTEALPALQEAWVELQPLVADAMKLITEAVIPALKEIGAFIMEHKTEIIAMLKGAWDVIAGTIQVALALITGVIKIAIALWHGDVEGAGKALTEMVRGVWDGLGRIIGGALDYILNSIAIHMGASVEIMGIRLRQMIDSVADTWDRIVKSVSEAASNVWETIVRWFTESKNWVVKTFTDILDYIMGLPGRWAKAGEEMVNALIDSIRDGLNRAYNNLRDGLGRLADLLPGSEPKDPTSPLRGLEERGAALIGNMQAGMDKERLSIDAVAPAMPSVDALGNSSVDRSRTANTTINFTINTQAPRESILQDIATAQAMAQVGML